MVLVLAEGASVFINHRKRNDISAGRLTFVGETMISYDAHSGAKAEETDVDPKFVRLSEVALCPLPPQRKCITCLVTVIAESISHKAQ